VSIQGLAPEVLIGETFHFQVVVSPDPAAIGYGPFVELYLERAGADCTGVPGTPERCDGLRFVQAAVALASSSLPLTPCPAAAAPFVFPVGPACSPPNPANCPGTTSTAPTSCFFGAAPPVCAGESTAGYQKVDLLLPFGSFVPGQPPIVVDVTARIDSFADEGAQLRVKARGGFRFADDPLGKMPASLDPTCPMASGTTTPKVLRLRKAYLGPESETATGPNFPRQYQLTVDVADEQTVNDLVVTDCLPGNLVFLSAAAPGATSSFDPVSHCLTVEYASVTGGPDDSDASFTFDFFVPEKDVSGFEVLGPSCKTPAPDHASAVADWHPQDPRDVPSEVSAEADHVLIAKCLALQKSVRIVQEHPGGAPGPTPGDIVEYRLDFQISDFRTLSSIVLEDFLSDGLTLLPGAWLQVTDKNGALGGPSTGLFTPGVDLLTSASQDVYTCPDGTEMFQPTQIELRVSDLLSKLASGIGRHGQGIVTGGRAGLPLDGPATGRVVLLARIDDVFQRQIGVELKVDKHDPLPNCVVVGADVRPNTNAPALPGPAIGEADDDSMAPLVIVHDRLRKSVFAVNGVTGLTPPPLVAPGDRVTFRVELPVPSTDAEDFVVDDFLPLPVFHVGSVFPLGPSCALPGAFPANTARLVGPLCTYLKSAGPSPTLTPQPPSNSLHLNLGTIQDPANQQRKLDFFFTVQASADPFADGLHLTNHVREQEKNTFGALFAQSEAAEIVLGQPRLRVRKGVVSTSRDASPPPPPPPPTAAVYMPAKPKIPGAVFNPPGKLPSFTGTLSSSNVGIGINSDVSNLDACDFVRIAIAVENIGTSPKGAFDVRISDVLQSLVPPCLVNPSKFQVTNGKGVPLSCNGGKSCSQLLENLKNLNFAITLDDGPATGALAPFSLTSGDNLAIITFDARIPCKTAVPVCCSDTARILGYAGVEGGPNHTQAGFSTPFPDVAKPFQDGAKVCVTPRLAKTIVKTSEPHTPHPNDKQATLAIGEIVRFRLEVAVPEGKSPQMTLVDTLPASLRWLKPTCAVVAKSAAVQTSPPVFEVSGNDTKLKVSFGNVTNTANNPGAEILAVECSALVRNRLNGNLINFSGDVKKNSFTLTVEPPAGKVTFTSNTVQVVIAEPAGVLTKQQVAPPPSASTAVYLLTYKNTGTTTAFDVEIADTLPASLVLAGSPVVTGPCKVDNTAPSGMVRVVCAKLPAEGTVTVQIPVAGVPLCRSVHNEARLVYTSLPGLGTPQGPANMTGASTPGRSGDDLGERVYGNTASVDTFHCPDLAIQKTHAGVFGPGQNGTYTVTVTNAGNIPSVPRLQVQDTLPAGVTFVSGGGDGWSCGAGGSLVICDPLFPRRSIPPGSSSSFTITVALSLSCDQRSFENCVEVLSGADSNPDNDRACDLTEVGNDPPPGCVVAIAAGGLGGLGEEGHSLALRSDGTVWAWGSNYDDQLGVGNINFPTLPVQVRGPGGVGFLTGVVGIGAGAASSMAIKADGTLWVWGAVDVPSEDATFPVQVPGLSDVVAAAGGREHWLALKADGTLWAWGSAEFLGTGGVSSDPAVPVQVRAPSGNGFLTGIIAIAAAGRDFSLAVKSDGTVWAWGDNGEGQLGNGTSGGIALLPVQVVGPGGAGFLTGVTAVAAGAGYSDRYSLAQRADGTVWAWGANGGGALGIGPADSSKVPVQVLGTGGVGFLTDVVAIAASAYHSVALLAGGTVRAWGDVLGDGSPPFGSTSNVPVAVSVLTGITAIAAGGQHDLALDGNRTVWAWGRSPTGETGQGTSDPAPVPIKVLAIPCPTCVPPPSGMRAWWDFDEPVGPVAHDRAGLVANDGAWTPATGLASGPGRVGGSLCFVGASARVVVPSSPELQLGVGDFTVDTWVRASLAPGVVSLLDKRQGDGRGYHLFLVNGRPGLQMADRAVSGNCSSLATAGCTNFAAPAGVSVADGQWHHIAVTVRRSPGGGTFYVDGVAVSTFDPTVRPLSLDSVAPLWIGAELPSATAAFKGCLDELEIFQRALDAQEVASIYQAGGAGKCKCVEPQGCVQVDPPVLSCIGKDGAGNDVLGFETTFDIGGPFSTKLETVTSPHGAVNGFLFEIPDHVGGSVADTPPPDNPLCLVFGFSAEGRFHCETPVCTPRPVCP
jgi:uncharacterized repeat protein (TIGR01451 family)/fimbrial isopeptide formation D2 family protein